MRPLVILNPKSGGGQPAATLAELRRIVSRALGTCEFRETTRPGHATELARGAADEGFDAVIGVGGDGTLSEVTAGVFQAGATLPVGIIGQGTGGDFRKSLGIEHRLDAYLAVIRAGATRHIDMGHATFEGHDGKKQERTFLNILSVGMGGLVDQYVAQSSRMLGGKAAYFGASLKALLNVRLGRLRCTVVHEGHSETRELSSYMLAVCNGRFFGGGMHVAPMAKLEDGLFEVVALNATSKLDFALRSGRIYDGKHLGDATHFRCSSLELELLNRDAAPHYLIDLDGEPAGRLNLSLRALPRAVRVFA
jgi:YegS/Rv2252/BmrU family lipid kinase